MGSKEIWNLEFRQAFVFISMYGMNEAIEKISQLDDDCDEVSVT